MDNLDIKNLQLSYQAVYDNTLCESMEELGIIGEARDGYGDDSKFKQDTDAPSFRPGKDVPKVKKFGRISRSIPHGIGAHANRTQSRVSTIIGKDPGAPRSEKMAQEKKKPKMVKKDGKWVKEAQDYYDIILAHLLDEGYAETVENAEAIMVNMSEEWVGSIVEEALELNEATYGTKKGRHELSMKIHKGEDIGKKNIPGKTGFKAVEAKAKKYGATNPKAVAAAAMWKKYGK